jgi:hypothetical protein
MAHQLALKINTDLALFYFILFYLFESYILSWRFWIAFDLGITHRLIKVTRAAV